jgi:hypothetical protein
MSSSYEYPEYKNLKITGSKVYQIVDGVEFKIIRGTVEAHWNEKVSEYCFLPKKIVPKYRVINIISKGQNASFYDEDNGESVSYKVTHLYNVFTWLAELASSEPAKIVSMKKCK